MRKILFWFEDAWAFGAIHNSLAKELYKHDIYSNLLHWEYKVKPEEWKLLYDTYDLFVTKPDTAPILNSFGIPYEKMAVVAHGQWDYLVYKEKFGIDYYNKLYKFGAVSNILKQKASEFGIPRVPDVMPLGVHFDFYYNKPSTKLQSVGYGGAKQVSNFFGQEIKRGYLVEQIVKNHTPLTLIEHNNYTWMAMPSYYSNIDSIVVSSIEEGAGLPSLEAACAGRLIFSTPVGYFEEHGPNGGGIVLPIETQSFAENLIKQLEFYYYNPDEYYKMCLSIQDYARENYDWSKHIDKWIEFLI